MTTQAHSSAPKPAPAEASSPNVSGGRGLGSEIAQTDWKTSSIAEVRERLRSATVEETIELHGAAAAYEMFAERTRQAEAQVVAGTAKLWCERRLGEMRSRISHFSQSDFQSKGDFDSRLGLGRWQARKWELLAAVPEETFERILADIADNDGAFNTSGVLSRANLLYETKVDRGIYQLADGRIVLQWKHMGVKHRKTLGHSDVTKARAELLEVTQGITVNRGRLRGPRTLDRAYTDVRVALWALGGIPGRSTLGENAWEQVQAAVSALHVAEDAIGSAIRSSKWSVNGGR